VAGDDDTSFERGLGVALLVGLAFFVLAGGFVWFLSSKASPSGAAPTQTVTVGQTTTTPAVTVTDPHVIAGGYSFVRFACAQCHGALGAGGVSPAVPALTTIGRVLTVQKLRNIIEHGMGVSADPKRPFMPVWGAVISKQQTADLVSYLRAGLPPVGATTQPIPAAAAPAAAGAVLYERFGCINCHGPNGLGGVPNPSSPDKTIPPLSGPGFRHDFNTRAKIIAVIQSGSVLGKQPIVSMPHWGGILTPSELQALADYIATLQ
jgi:mono/diheme cytochrome c family protein